MSVIKFKTSLSCGGCVAKITDPLNKLKEKSSDIESWNVDTDNPDKVLTLNLSCSDSENITAEVITIVEAAGFDAEVIN